MAKVLAECSRRTAAENRLRLARDSFHAVRSMGSTFFLPTNAPSAGFAIFCDAQKGEARAWTGKGTDRILGKVASSRKSNLNSFN